MSVQDNKAINLLRDFVKEKLGGDIYKLRTYDFTTLDDDRKYGSTNHTDAPIIKAVLSVAFGDVWPGLSMDQMEHGPYKCATIQTYQNLFGINMCDQYFKGMQYFKPSDFQFQRALRIAHLTYSVGNLWVLPGNGTISNRILDNSYRYYMDKFLKNIYAVLTEQKRVDKTLQKAIENSPQMKPYYGEEGFQKFIHDMMLEDYVDYYGKPMDIFDFVWSSMRGLDRDKYFKAVDQYCSFCEKAFAKRAEKVVKKLEMILSSQPAIQKAERPIAVTELPKPKPAEKQSEENTITRYGLAYNLMNMCIEIVKDDLDNRLPLMTEEGYFIDICKSLNLKPEGFIWDDFLISIEKFEGITVIFYSFPSPQKEPEAIFGALMLDLRTKNLTYYTLEMCHHPGRWALGRNTTDHHALMGMYDIEPTKENFLKLIVPKEKLLPEIDIRSLLNLPEEYKVLEKTSAAPMYCVNYGKKTSSCLSFIQAFPIIPGRNMEYYNETTIIKGIQKSLSDDGALIEVKVGRTNSGNQFSYSIIKLKKEASGVLYYLIMYVAYENIAINIKGDFIESGTTGLRDTMVWELARREGIVSSTDNSKWCFDPYDKTSKRPYLMNLSEKEEYDEMFPDYPLSQCRKFIQIVIQKL